MTSGTRTFPSVVLVRGAWADASGWDDEIRPRRRPLRWQEKAEEDRSRIVDRVSGGYKPVAPG